MATETSIGMSQGSGTNIAGASDTAGNFQQLIMIGDGTVNQAKLPNGIMLFSDGGVSANFAITSGKNSATVISANPGRLCKVTVVTLGTAACIFYDNASAASGNVVGTVTASAAVGTIFNFQCVVANGITASASSSNPALTVQYV